MLLTITEIQDEAVKFRKLIETCDKEKTSLVISDFPVMSCKLTSMLLSFHFLQLCPELVINDIVIDITGDQYNIIDDKELNNNIINSRPFPAVHVAHKEDSYLHKIFKNREEEYLISGSPTIKESFIEKMKSGYSQLLNNKHIEK